MVIEEPVHAPSESSVEDEFYRLIENNVIKSAVNVNSQDAKKYFLGLLEEYIQAKKPSVNQHPVAESNPQQTDQMKLKLHQTEKNCQVLKKGMLVYNKKFEALKSKNDFMKKENDELRLENVRLRVS